VIDLNERRAYLSRVLPDGRVADLFPLTLGRVRLTISEDEAATTFTEAW
jgi:hypothetical protein